MTQLSMKDTLKLADGNQLPQEGFGVYKLTDQDVMDQVINTAIEAGYRLFDTAQLYENEDLLGNSLQASELTRDQYFITTKVAENNQGYDKTITSVQKSLDLLKTDYVDLLLVHWPIHTEFFETWRAFEDLKAQGLAKSIGVSNFHQTHLQYLATKAHEMPVVNQIELHPYFSQPTMRAFDVSQNIVTQAWSPLGRGLELNDDIINGIATKLGKSSAQVILRWEIQNGIAVIPKSANPKRVVENASIYDFELSDEEMAAINSLNKNQRTGHDPELVYEQAHQ